MTSGERRPLPGSDHRSRYQWGACATSRGRQQPGHKMFQAMTRPGLLGARDPVLGCLFGFFFSAEHRPNISQNSCYDMVCCQPYQALAFSSTSNQVHTKSQGRPLQESDAPFARERWVGRSSRPRTLDHDLGSKPAVTPRIKERQVENNNLGDTVRFHVLCKYYCIQCILYCRLCVRCASYC